MSASGRSSGLADAHHDPPGYTMLRRGFRSYKDSRFTKKGGFECGHPRWHSFSPWPWA